MYDQCEKGHENVEVRCETDEAKQEGQRAMQAEPSVSRPPLQRTSSP